MTEQTETLIRPMILALMDEACAAHDAAMIDICDAALGFGATADQRDAALKQLNITSISYRTNIITPNCQFRSKHVEATATVGANENPADVLVDLAGWVHDQLGITRQPTAALRNLGDED